MNGRREINDSVQVMPVDWGPPDHYAGVIDIADLANDSKAKLEMLKKHAAQVHRILERTFSVDALYSDLQRHDRALRKCVSN